MEQSKNLIEERNTNNNTSKKIFNSKEIKEILESTYQNNITVINLSNYVWEDYIQYSLFEYKGKVTAVETFSNNKLLVSLRIKRKNNPSVSDSILELWDLDNKECIETFMLGSDYTITNIATLPNNQLAITFSPDINDEDKKDPLLKILDWQTKKYLHVIPCKATQNGFNKKIIHVAVLSDQRLAISGINSIQIYDLKTGNITQTFKTMEQVDAMFSLTKSQLLCRYENNYRILNLNLGESEIEKSLAGTTVHRQANGKLLYVKKSHSRFSSHISSELSVLDPATGKQFKVSKQLETKAREMGMSEFYGYFQILSDDKMIVQASSDRENLFVFDWQANKILFKLKGPFDRIIKFLPLTDNSFISVYEHHEVLVWKPSYRSLTLADIKPLLLNLHTNSTVIELNLANIEIGDPGITDLVSLLQKNTILQTINLMNTGITETGVTELLKVLSARSKMTKIILDLNNHAAYTDYLESIIVNEKTLHTYCQQSAFFLKEALSWWKLQPYSEQRETRLATLTHLAARYDYPEVLEEAFICGVDLQVRDDHQCTPLHTCAIHGSAKAAMWLLEKGAQIAEKNEDDNTPLHLSVLHNQSTIITTLISYCRQYSIFSDEQFCSLLDNVNKLGQTPLWLAIKNQNSEVVNYLVLNGSSIDLQNKSGHNALQQAVIIGDFKTLTVLIDQLPSIQDLNVVDSNKKSLLHLAIAQENGLLVKFLIEKGVDYNLKNKLDETALEFAKNTHPSVYGYVINSIRTKTIEDKKREVEAKRRREPLCFREKHAPEFIQGVELCRAAERETEPEKIKSNYEEALIRFNKIPQFLDALLCMSYCNLWLQRPHAAQKVLEDLIEKLSNNGSKESERLAEVYYWKGQLLYSTYQGDEPATAYLAAYHHTNLACEIRPHDNYYRSELDRLRKQLQQLIAGNVAKLIFKKEVANDWCLAISIALQAEKRFTSRLESTSIEQKILADCLHKRLNSAYAKEPQAKYQHIKPIVKEAVNRALDEWDNAFEQFRKSEFTQSLAISNTNLVLLQKDTNSNTQPQSNKAFIEPKGITQAGSFFFSQPLPIMSSAISYAKLHFCEKLKEILNETYAACFGYTRKLVERKTGAVDEVLNFVDKANYLTGSFLGVEGTLALKAITAAGKKIRDGRAEHASVQFVQLAQDIKAAAILFERVANEIADRYEKQLAKLSPLGIETLATCGAARMIQYIGSNQGQYSTLAEEAFYRLVTSPVKSLFNTVKNKFLRSIDKSLAPNKDRQLIPAEQKLLYGILLGVAETKTDYGTYLETLPGVSNYENPWYAESLFIKTGILSSEGEYYSSCDCEVEKYGFRKGAREEAAELGMTKVLSSQMEVLNTTNASEHSALPGSAKALMF